jgi:uncharacterized protein (DUF1810 family)
MADRWDLERFVAAQGDDTAFGRVLAELRSGRKTTHWMWYVFPQIAGLGQSPISRRFAISSLAEARAYLQHPVLGPRLREATGIVATTENRTAQEIFGSIDALKLRSSVTLFLRAAPDEVVFGEVLARFFDNAPDASTDELLGV